MNFLKRLFRQIVAGDLQLVAAALAFTTAMSIIPFFAVTLSVLGYIDAFDSLYPKVELLFLNYFKGPAGAEGTAIIRKILSRIHDGKLGKLGAVTLVITSVLLLKNMELGINRVWGITIKRKIWKSVLSYRAIFLSLPIGLAIYTGMSSHKALTSLGGKASWQGLNFIAIFLLLFLVYKLVPHTKVSTKAASLGASFATVGLNILFAIFGWLTSAVFNYSKVYGSIAALPALLVWILLIWYIILMGVAISATLDPPKS